MSETRPMLIRGGLVLDAAGFLGSRDILVQGGAIAALEPPGMAAPDGAEVIDAPRRLIHPGLVNAHTHGHGNIFKSAGDRWTLELLLAAGPWLSSYEGAEEKRISATIGAAEMVLKGCTACYDLFVELPGPTEDGIEAVAEAYRTVGMRAVIAPMLADLTFYQAIPGLAHALPPGLQATAGAMRMPPWQETIATMRRVLSSWRFDRDWLRPAVAPTIPLHCQDPFLTACRDLAREFELGMHSHVAESKVQAVSGQTRYGRSLVAHLDALGLISDKFTAAHGVWLDRDDMARLGSHGASVAHNPASNMRLGNGVADMHAMLASGINVGIGTDAATCGDNLNMYGSMHFAAGSSHARSPDPADWVTAEQVWEAATTGSARALGFEHVGRVAPGYAADLVFLDLDCPTLIPLNAPVNQIVFGEDGTSVRDVMIGGRFVVRDARLLTVDLPALAARAEALRTRMLKRNAERRSAFECVVPVLDDFCPSLSRTKWPINRYCGC